MQLAFRRYSTEGGTEIALSCRDVLGEPNDKRRRRGSFAAAALDNAVVTRGQTHVTPIAAWNATSAANVGSASKHRLVACAVPSTAQEQPVSFGETNAQEDNRSAVCHRPLARAGSTSGAGRRRHSTTAPSRRPRTHLERCRRHPTAGQTRPARGAVARRRMDGRAGRPWR